MTFWKPFLGFALGAAAGYGYHLFMNKCGSTWINAKSPAVPVIFLAAIGVWIGWTATKDW